MSQLSRLLDTTVFRLVLVNLAVFAIASVGLIVFISVATTELIEDQLEDAINAEIRALGEQYQFAGLPGLVRAVERRSVRPGAGLYLLTDFAGNPIAGNIAEITTEVPGGAATGIVAATYRRMVPAAGRGEPGVADTEETGALHRALAREFVLKGGFRLIVGRDVEERLAFTQIIRQATQGTIVVVLLLALLGYLFVSRRVVKKVDAIAETGEMIVAGDLSGRLPVYGSNDEFDRLAISVNAMLDRIEQLDHGLREVSDNIAHDLKTPLTRMRNRIEERLRAGSDDPETRAVLEGVIAESENLIRTFNALLMIARVESVSTDTKIESCDIMELIRDIADLYEAVVEEAGARFTLDAEGELFVPLNPELVRPMVANLVDNAIKYGSRTSEPVPEIRLGVEHDETTVTIVVSDNGPGIPEADRERVTRRFERLSGDRSAPGAGLGLSLVKAVVQYHGGTLVFGDNHPGLVVRVTFPRRRGRR